MRGNANAQHRPASDLNAWQKERQTARVQFGQTIFMMARNPCRQNSPNLARAARAHREIAQDYRRRAPKFNTSASKNDVFAGCC